MFFTSLPEITYLPSFRRRQLPSKVYGQIVVISKSRLLARCSTDCLSVHSFVSKPASILHYFIRSLSVEVFALDLENDLRLDKLVIVDLQDRQSYQTELSRGLTTLRLLRRCSDRRRTTASSRRSSRRPIHHTMTSSSPPFRPPPTFTRLALTTGLSATTPPLRLAANFS